MATEFKDAIVFDQRTNQDGRCKLVRIIFETIQAQTIVEPSCQSRLQFLAMFMSHPASAKKTADKFLRTNIYDFYNEYF